MNKSIKKKYNRTKNNSRNKKKSKKNFKGGYKRLNLTIANKINNISPTKCNERDENSCYLATNCKWNKDKSECHDIDDIGGINCSNLSWYGCLKPCKWTGSMLNGYCQYKDEKNMSKPKNQKEELLDEMDLLVVELKRIKREDDKLSKKKLTPSITKKRLELRSKHREIDLEVKKLNNLLQRIKDHADLEKLSVNN